MTDLLQTVQLRQKEEGATPIRDTKHTPPEDSSASLIREAEASKGRMFTTKGNKFDYNAFTCDENYQVIGGNIEQSIRQKIINHEYIDFARLLPQDRVFHEDNHRMEIVNKGGLLYFVPVADRDTTSIHNFNKWEQAFCVFSNIYTHEYPHRATELIQYNQVIFSAAQNFVWENVYHYDREFRVHLSNFPYRSWSVILQQAWTMCLKDRIKGMSDDYRSGSSARKNRKGEACKCFNKGKCTAGLSCKYNHRCTVPDCGKFGHGAHICHKRNQNTNSSMAFSTPAGSGQGNQSK